MDLSFLHVALELEREACNLYTGLSGEARGAGGRRAFLFLARQEREHIARVETEIEKRKVHSETLPSDTATRVAQFRTKLMAASQEISKRTRSAVTEHTNEMRSLEIAAMMEDFLCCFYREAISGTESRHSKEFFQKMLQMERAHLDILHGCMAHLEETGHLPADKVWRTTIAP
jgi:rubrerythrin